jgi:uncharacterized protein (TIGR02246 family)
MSTLEDELALRNLMSRYVDAVNRYDAEQWISTWAEDGVWNLLGTPVQGRDAILGLWQQMMATFEYALLFPSSCLFNIDGDSASGHWYIHEYSRDLEGNKTAILSRYVDTYSKTDGQWLFQTRDYGFIYNGPPDFSGDFTRPA